MQQPLARLGEIGAALCAGDSAAAVSSFKHLWSVNLVHLLGRAAQTIEDSAPRIAKARPLSGQRAVGSEDKVRASARSVLSIYSKTKLDSANATHAELLALLSDFLGSHGHRVETNQFVDAFTRLKSGPAIFEAKSITDENELCQVRHGLSQLFEYRYRHGINDASLVPVALARAARAMVDRLLGDGSGRSRPLDGQRRTLGAILADAS